jgi:hypothetical protein
VDNDADVDLDDWTAFSECLAGPDESDPPVGCDPACFVNADLAGDNDVDLEDFTIFQDVATGG